LNRIPSELKPDKWRARIGELRAGLVDQKPEELANKSGIEYHPHNPEQGEFHFLLWDRKVSLSFPELLALDIQTNQALADSSLALLLYYLTTCDGTSAFGQWVSFSDLPDGRFYNHAFQNYTGAELARTFKDDFEAFLRYSEILKGKRVYLLGDAAYRFQVLPLVNLLVVTWQGDEDFDSTYQVLFDAAVHHHLPTDACAIIGGILTRRLIAEKESHNEISN
jgi:hypothetical protein